MSIFGSIREQPIHFTQILYFLTNKLIIESRPILEYFEEPIGEHIDTQKFSKMMLQDWKTI